MRYTLPKAHKKVRHDKHNNNNTKLIKIKKTQTYLPILFLKWKSFSYYLLLNLNTFTNLKQDRAAMILHLFNFPYYGKVVWVKNGPTPGIAVKVWHTSVLYIARAHHYYPFLTVFIPDEIKKTDLIKVWQYIKVVIAPMDHNIVDIDDTLSHFIPV